MQQFATPAAFTASSTLSAVLGIPAGHIRVIAADRADATVEVLPANPARSRDVKAAEGTRIGFADGVLTVTGPDGGNQLFGPSGSVELTVQLPAGSRVEVEGAATAFRGVGRLGDVAVTAAQGPVKVDEAAGLRVTLQDGDVTVGRLTGPARISTMRGDIRIAEAERGTVDVTTRKGDITLGTAPGVSATLDAGTSCGRVDNGLRNGEGAAAPLTFRATTAYGDVTARSL
ncbi:DUF4097 family beta strand repeat-containing protein [Streptomyces roseicoloratus]|uniref:DUF4097 family beta strand repeat-containing protein n=1 Tax=Streptomyces roseicoloratus TaxID=2508722 RepID=UPI001009A384|nr:DUF4097 family beta strand repeat-containing protein [Streptomyces roseicoloratus]